MSEIEITEEYDESPINHIDDDQDNYENDDDISIGFCSQPYDQFQAIEDKGQFDPDDDDSEYEDLDF